MSDDNSKSWLRNRPRRLQTKEEQQALIDRVKFHTDDFLNEIKDDLIAGYRDGLYVGRHGFFGEKEWREMLDYIENFSSDDRDELVKYLERDDQQVYVSQEPLTEEEEREMYESLRSCIVVDTEAHMARWDKYGYRV